MAEKKSRSISRRRFLESGAVVAGAAVLAACAPQPTAAPTAAPTTAPTAAPATTAPTAAPTKAAATVAPTTAPAAAQPVKGGKLTYGQVGDLKDLDPFDMLSLNYPFFYNLYDSLLRYDNKLGIHPRLATSWDVDKDQTKITLKLRQGVKWHNGREFVADDVVKNFERGTNDVKGLNVYGMLSPVFSKGTAIDQYTVQLEFKAPTPNLFDLLNAICMHAP
jgi:ABC-type transport system substrate-binding protein